MVVDCTFKRLTMIVFWQAACSIVFQGEIDPVEVNGHSPCKPHGSALGPVI